MNGRAAALPLQSQVQKHQNEVGPGPGPGPMEQHCPPLVPVSTAPVGGGDLQHSCDFKMFV